MIADLRAMLPALLDTLSYVGVAITVLADRGKGLERIYINAPGAAMLGYTLDEIWTRPPIEGLLPEQRERVLQMSASFRAGRPVPATIEFTVIRKDGSTTPVEFALGATRMPDGIAYVIVLRDVSAHQQAQLSLLEADRIALVGALASGFAHEINNPLTSVLLNLRLLRRHLTTGLPASAQHAALRCLDDINTGAERIASNVSALQSLATRRDTCPPFAFRRAEHQRRAREPRQCGHGGGFRRHRRVPALAAGRDRRAPGRRLAGHAAVG